MGGIGTIKALVRRGLGVSSSNSGGDWRPLLLPWWRASYQAPRERQWVKVSRPAGRVRIHGILSKASGDSRRHRHSLKNPAGPRGRWCGVHSGRRRGGAPASGLSRRETAGLSPKQKAFEPKPTKPPSRQAAGGSATASSIAGSLFVLLRLS
jgi:hypothetical protein